MSDIPAQIQEDIKTAMKAKDSLALNALRALKSALTNASIEKGGLGTALEESEVLSVVRKQIKQRHDSCRLVEIAIRDFTLGIAGRQRKQIDQGLCRADVVGLLGQHLKIDFDGVVTCGSDKTLLVHRARRCGQQVGDRDFRGSGRHDLR